MNRSPLRLVWTGLGMLLLSACTGTPAPATVTPTASPSPQPPTVTPAPTPTPAVTARPFAGGKMSCTLESRLLPTPNATEQSLFPAVGEQDWVQGPPDAEVTFIEYSDFQ